jgi:hypothetical protein
VIHSIDWDERAMLSETAYSEALGGRETGMQSLRTYITAPFSKRATSIELWVSGVLQKLGCALETISAIVGAHSRKIERFQTALHG